MAIEVGKEVAASKDFDKVIFSVVSNDPNLKKIRDNIANQLGLPIDEKMGEFEQAQSLWKRIFEGEEKILIILDDMWKRLTLQDIGIPPGYHNKGCCVVLLTTRDYTICRDMECHEIIKLKVLKSKDAVNLFLSYAGISTDGSSNDFEDVALGIVKECGKLPVAIITVARALKSRPIEDWEDALERLQNYEPVNDVNEDLKEAYNSLKLSYDNLKNEKAKQLVLLCSLFPEDYEIPIELLTRIAIGLGLCGEANKYSKARSQFTPIKNELIDSCLLSKSGHEYVKMHDLVREVALWIGNKQVQAITNSNTTLIENIQYSSRNIKYFPSHFCNSKLKVLLFWIDGIDKVPNALFEEIGDLKVLVLEYPNWSQLQISALSLLQPLQALKNVQTLTMKRFKLGDISIVASLKSLTSLELIECSIIELPDEIREVEKLRLLELRYCEIERNNPFEVIGRSSQLEELYFVSCVISQLDHEKLPQITTLPKLHRYHISISISGTYEADFSTFRFFNSKNLGKIFSNEIFAFLVAEAEILELIEDNYNRGWANIVPNAVPVKEKGLKDHLTKLYLESCSEIKCLVYTEHLRSSMTIFSKLVELQLHEMCIRELCCGPYPVDFLKQLKNLKLVGCQKLEGTLFGGKLELGNLESINLMDCSMTCLFHPSTAQSLKQLRQLEIYECSQLNYIVKELIDDHDDTKQQSYEVIFSKLESLQVQLCGELEFILPSCFCEDLPLVKSVEIMKCEKLKYIFGQYPRERDLHQMEKETVLQLLEQVIICDVPNFISMYAECYLPLPCAEVQKLKDESNSLSRCPLCCFWPKSNASTIHHPSSSNAPDLNHIQASSKVKYVVERANGVFTPPLYPYNSLRKLQIERFSELKSLFTLSVASSLKLLEQLEVRYCDALEQIVTDEGRCHHDDIKVSSIFPKLKEVNVYNCGHLEYVFLAFYSKDFQHLGYVIVMECEKMKYVFGGCDADLNHNVDTTYELHLPALESLHLYSVPNMFGICTENYYVKAPHLQDIHLRECPQLPLQTMEFWVDVQTKQQDDLSRRNESKAKSELSSLNIAHGYFVPPLYQCNLRVITIQGFSELKSLFTLSIASSMKLLKSLEVNECHALEQIVKDEGHYGRDDDTTDSSMFPNLSVLQVSKCSNLKCLFSMSTYCKLPKLRMLDIEDAPQLGQVFECEQEVKFQELAMKDVLPKLIGIRLVNLPSLHTIYHELVFQNVEIRVVRHCPNISLTSANDSVKEVYAVYSSLSQREMHWEDDEDYHYGRRLVVDWFLKLQWEQDHQIFLREWTKIEQDNSSSNLANSKQASQEVGEEDSAIPKRHSSSPNLTESEEASNQIAEKESAPHKHSNNLPNMVKIAKEIIELNAQEGSKLDGAIKENQIMNSTSSNSSPTASIAPRENKSPHEVEATVREGPLSERHDANKEKVDASVHGSPELEEAVISNQVKDSELSTMPAPFSSPLQVESAQTKEIVEESSVLRSQKSKEAVLADEVMESKLSNIPSPFSSPLQIEYPQESCGKESTAVQQALGESRSFCEASQRVEEPTNQSSSEETSISSPKKPQMEIPATQSDLGNSKSDLLHISAITESAQEKIMNQPETSTEEEIMLEHRNSQKFVEDDLMRLFQIMEEGHMPHVSKISVPEDASDVTKALFDLEATLKMSLDEIASSEESRLCLENALNTLSSHCSEDGPPSHGLQPTIHSLQLEIQTVVSSFNQAYATIDTFNKLEQKEKLINEERSQRKEATIALLSEIDNTESSLTEAQQIEADLKEKISKLQDELYSKVKEIEEYKIKLSSLKEQKKKRVSDTMRFIKEFETVKKERSHMVEDHMKAEQQLQNMDVKWSSCLSNLKKTALLLGVHLQQKL